MFAKNGSAMIKINNVYEYSVTVIHCTLFLKIFQALPSGITVIIIIVM